VVALEGAAVLEAFAPEFAAAELAPPELTPIGAAVLTEGAPVLSSLLAELAPVASAIPAEVAPILTLLEAVAAAVVGEGGRGGEGDGHHDGRENELTHAQLLSLCPANADAAKTGEPGRQLHEPRPTPCSSGI
jgi:hypothetical protein